MNRKEQIIKELLEIENRKKELERELEKIKMEEYGFKYKVVLPYECNAKAVGDYIAYFKTKEEAKKVLESLKKGKIAEADWQVASEEVVDVWGDDFEYNEAYIQEQNIQQVGLI